MGDHCAYTNQPCVKCVRTPSSARSSFRQGFEVFARRNPAAEICKLPFSKALFLLQLLRFIFAFEHASARSGFFDANFKSNNLPPPQHFFFMILVLFANKKL